MLKAYIILYFIISILLKATGPSRHGKPSPFVPNLRFPSSSFLQPSHIYNCISQQTVSVNVLTSLLFVSSIARLSPTIFITSSLRMFWAQLIFLFFCMSTFRRLIFFFNQYIFQLFFHRLKKRIFLVIASFAIGPTRVHRLLTLF